MPAHPPDRAQQRQVPRGTLSGREIRELAAKLYAERHDDLLDLARRHGPREIDPEDTLQAAFAAFVEHFDLTRELAFAWLLTTTKRLAWRAQRTVSRRREAPEPHGQSTHLDEPAQLVYRLPAETGDPVARAIEREQARERLEAVREIDELPRLVISLVALGYSHPEIEAITGLSSRQIRRYAQRTYQRLAER